MLDFYVYAYIDPRDNTPFYIGKGHGGRARKHLLPHKVQEGIKQGRFFYFKLQKLLDESVLPEIRFVHRHLTEKQALEWETFFIKALGRRDLGTGCLCNLTNGGQGLAGRKVSEVTRQKLRKANLGQKRTSETKARMSEVQKQRHARQRVSAETRRRQSVSLKKVMQTAEVRARLSKAKMGHQVSIETRQKNL